ncbi:MAG: flippase-like domain-containing protein [candidate division KSB1 bacterium]|nr:flippase-like domain-containing protein [candidate division KSB1 bacterium]MDZ7368832.1 flippase-like domain-containing protein [candidate division KSB1 bacterium]MDZ7407408.1 flippase-like domain-containing protein [candidate division KSB1 bacterium]
MQKRLVLGLAISAVFIYLAFRKIDFVQMWEALQQANYLWLFPAAGFMFISLWLRAVRWGYFMEPIKPGITRRKLFSAMMIGYYGNNVFPLRAGEVLRAYAIGKSAGVSRMASFATIFVERLIDVLALLLLIAFSIIFHDYPAWVEKGSVFIFIGTVVVTIFMIALMLRTQQTLRVMSRLTRPLPENAQQFVNKLLGSFLDGFSIFKKTDRFWAITWQSVAMWLLYAAVNYAVLEAFGLNESLPIGASFVILVIVNLSIMIPAAPGYVGTFHLAAQQAAMLFEVSGSTALSFALILHIANFIPITLVGFYYFYREQLSLKEAVAAEEKEQAPPVPRASFRKKIGV